MQPNGAFLACRADAPPTWVHVSANVQGLLDLDPAALLDRSLLDLFPPASQPFLRSLINDRAAHVLKSVDPEALITVVETLVGRQRA